MELYPLIDLKKTEQPPFWVYNNFAFLYHSYLKSYENNIYYYVMGDYQMKPKLDERLDVKLSINPNLKDVYFIDNKSFGWVEQNYYRHFVESEYPHNWIFSDYVIGCFSAKYEFFECKVPGFIDDEIHNIDVFDFESEGLSPDSERMDLLVKDKLKNIDIEWTPEERFREGSLLPSKIYAFFDFHLLDYDGDPHDFVNHSDELIKDIWGFKNAKNIRRTNCFNKWVEDTIQKFGLDRLKLNLESKITSESPQQENVPVKNTTYYPESYTQIASSTILKPLWVYNNLVHIKGVANEYFKLKIYANDKTKELTLYVSGDDYRNRLNDFFDYVNKHTYTDFSFNLPTDEVPYNWQFDDYAFNILYFELLEPFNEETELYKFNSDGEIRKKILPCNKNLLYPNLTKSVKNYLKNIDSGDLDKFLNFHFKNCYDAFKFLIHIIEITDDIWGNSQNEISCKKVLKKWIKGKIDFLEISNPQVLIDIYISQKKTEYDEEFIAKDFQGNILLNEYGDSYSNAVPFEVFYNAKLEVKIHEFFQLNEKNTPEPPQAQNEEIEDLMDGHLWDKLALIHYLNKHKLLKLDTLHQDNTKIASVFSFLIGNSAESIRQKLSRVKKNEFNPSLKNLENILPIVKLLEHKELIEEIETEIEKHS